VLLANLKCLSENMERFTWIIPNHVVVELYRVHCSECGIKVEKVPPKAPFSKRFEEAVELACESAAPAGWRERWDCQRVPCARSTCAI